jgi:dTDP-4-dehydrorhamnose reductase
MNILVTGGNGQLGNELRVAAAKMASAPGVQVFPDEKKSSEKYLDTLAPQRSRASFNFLFTDVTEASEESVAMLRKLGGDSVDTSTTKLDITDLAAIRAIVREHQIDAIINCAAWTNVDGAEDPEKYALVEKLNATAPENLAKAMKEVDGWLVQISTDYVFGKEPYNTPCKEDQKGTPTGVYGATKLLGEQKIIATGCKHIIIRTAWLYSEFGKNFVRTMLNLTATRPQLKVVFDQTGTPTYAGDLANTIMAILAKPFAGTYHYSNEGVCSWFDFTKTIAEMAGQTKCEILPCHSNEFPSPVTRPSYSVLDKTKIKETFGLTIPYWTDSLRRCLSALL